MPYFNWVSAENKIFLTLYNIKLYEIMQIFLKISLSNIFLKIEN